MKVLIKLIFCFVFGIQNQIRADDIVYTCLYETRSFSGWSSHSQCTVSLGSTGLRRIDSYERSSFTGTSSEKSGATSVGFANPSQVDFLPLSILTEFPSVTGIDIEDGTYPVLNNDLFTSAFKNIEYVRLKNLNMYAIERNALYQLTKLKWISFHSNSFTNLDDEIFSNNLALEYVVLASNSIVSINPNVFTNIKNVLVSVDLSGNACYSSAITSFASLDTTLQPCYATCLADPICSIKAGQGVPDCDSDTCCDDIAFILTKQFEDQVASNDEYNTALNTIYDIERYCNTEFQLDTNQCQTYLDSLNSQINSLNNQITTVETANYALIQEILSYKKCRWSWLWKDKVSQAIGQGQGPNKENANDELD